MTSAKNLSSYMPGWQIVSGRGLLVVSVPGFFGFFSRKPCLVPPIETINEVFVRSHFCGTVYIATLSLFSSSIYEFTNPDTCLVNYFLHT